MLTTSLLLTTLAIHWGFGRWLSKYSPKMHLTYKKASKMRRHTHLVILSWIYISVHQICNGYEQENCRQHILIPSFTETNAIKQRNYYRWISVNMMTSYKSRRTAKGKRKNQRGGKMVLRSGTTTQSKGVNRKRMRVSNQSRVQQHLPFLCTCFKSNEKHQKDIIAHANIGQIEAIGEIALNLLKGNIVIPNSSFQKLRPHKSKPLYLIRKKPSLKQKKAVLNQKGGFLSALNH